MAKDFTRPPGSPRAGTAGRVRSSSGSRAAPISRITAKVHRQPRSWHTAVPSGTPSTAATEKPPYTREMARAVWSGAVTSLA